MDRDRVTAYPAPPALRAMLAAAQDFGLTPEEAWTTLDAALVGPRYESTAAEYVDEIAGAFAQAILAKQRRILADGAA
jgi:hypothetical protein